MPGGDVGHRNCSPAVAKRRLTRVLDLLSAAFGRPRWKSWGCGIGVLVETILSQNTSSVNSRAGYRQLRRAFPTWNAVADAPVSAIEAAIRISGLSRVKAPRIRRILRQIRESHGRLSLQFLRKRHPDDAYAYLMSFDGVGPKTANCLLLFSFGMPVFPVDTHIHRIAIRMGIVPPKTTAGKTQELMTPLIAPDDRYAMHILLIRHGRVTCRARNPRCAWCELWRMCPYGRSS